MLLQLGELSMVFASTVNMAKGSVFCFTVVADQQKYNCYLTQIAL